MNSYFKNNLKQAFLVLESDEEDVELDDYQIAMLQENRIPGILETNIRYVDGICQYYYDISGMNSFHMLHEKSSLSCEDIRSLTESLLQTIKQLQRFMITENKILLDPDYIFCEKDAYYFCYYPLCKEELTESFHKLTEFFVREVNYKDEEGVKLAYTLHKSTMEEHYSVERILEEFEQEKGETTVIDYTQRMENTSLEEVLIAEKTEIWEPIRRFLEKRKKTCQ